MLKKYLVVPITLAFCFIFTDLANTENVNATSINWPAQAVDTVQTIEVFDLSRFSIQAVYAQGTPSADTISDGVKASVTITVPTTTTGLIGAAASGTINVTSSSTVSGDSVVVFGFRYTEGSEWTAETSSTTSATNLAAAINTHPDVSATSSGSTVTVTAVSLGSAGNSYTLTTTDASNLVVSGANFTGGVDAPTININGTVLTEDTDFDIVSSSATSATNIADAIAGDATLSAIFSTSTSNNVVTITAIDASSDRYFITASTTGLTTGVWTMGDDPDIDIDLDTISETDHGFTTGLDVLFANSSGTDPGGLSDGTTYYVIKISENLYQLASSTANAVAGTEIDITGITGSGSFTATPLAFSTGSTGFHWEASNDGTNWADLSVSSITFSAAGNTLWDFGEFNYRFIRINFVGPTQGGLNVTATLNGKK